MHEQWAYHFNCKKPLEAFLEARPDEQKKLVKGLTSQFEKAYKETANELVFDCSWCTAFTCVKLVLEFQSGWQLLCSVSKIDSSIASITKRLAIIEVRYIVPIRTYLSNPQEAPELPVNMDHATEDLNTIRTDIGIAGNGARLVRNRSATMFVSAMIDLAGLAASIAQGPMAVISGAGRVFLGVRVGAHAVLAVKSGEVLYRTMLQIHELDLLITEVDDLSRVLDEVQRERERTTAK